MSVAVSNHYQRVRYETARRRSKEQQQSPPNVTYAEAERTILRSDTGTVPMFPPGQAGQPGSGPRFPWPPHIAVNPQAAGVIGLQ